MAFGSNSKKRQIVAFSVAHLKKPRDFYLFINKLLNKLKILVLRYMTNCRN